MVSNASKKTFFENDILPLQGKLVGYIGYEFPTLTLEDKEDLVEETLEKAYRNLDKFEQGTSLFAWLKTISKNVVLNYFRSLKSRPTIVAQIDANADGGVDSSQTQANSSALAQNLSVSKAIEENATKSPLENQNQNIINKHLENAILKLPKKQKKALLSVVVDGYKYEEAAQKLEIPIGTLMSRLSRAKEAVSKSVIESVSADGAKTVKEYMQQDSIDNILRLLKKDKKFKEKFVKAVKQGMQG